MMKHPSAGVKRELVADQSILNPHCERGAHTLGHYLTMRPARSQLLPLRSSLRGRESTVVVPPLKPLTSSESASTPPAEAPTTTISCPLIMKSPGPQTHGGR